MSVKAFIIWIIGCLVELILDLNQLISLSPRTLYFLPGLLTTFVNYIYGLFVKKFHIRLRLFLLIILLLVKILSNTQTSLGSLSKKFTLSIQTVRFSKKMMRCRLVICKILDPRAENFVCLLIFTNRFPNIY